MATTYTAIAIRNNGETIAIKTFSRKEYAVAAANADAEANYRRAVVITSGGKQVHEIDRTRQNPEVTIVLAGRVAKALGVVGTVTPSTGKGVQVTTIMLRSQARRLAAAIANSDFKASTTARHLARIDAALAA